MRTIFNYGVMILVCGALLGAGRSVQACHGCHRQKARVQYTCSVPARGYGYSTYNYGAIPYCSWVYPGAATAGTTAKTEPAKTSPVAERPASELPLTQRVARLEKDMGNIQRDLTRIIELLEGRRPEVRTP